MTRALYPGKFDPFHNGHLDIATRAASLFAHLIVAVYETPSAKLLFDTTTRLDLACQATAHLANVEVVTYSGLTVTCAHHWQAQVIVRGLRNIADYEYEYQVGMANRKMAPGIELCCLITDANHAFLSATILKEVASLHGDFTSWAPSASVAALQARFTPDAESDRARDGVSPVRSKLSHQG